MGDLGEFRSDGTEHLLQREISGLHRTLGSLNCTKQLALRKNVFQRDLFWARLVIIILGSSSVGGRVRSSEQRKHDTCTDPANSCESTGFGYFCRTAATFDLTLVRSWRSLRSGEMYFSSYKMIFVHLSSDAECNLSSYNEYSHEMGLNIAEKNPPQHCTMHM